MGLHPSNPRVGLLVAVFISSYKQSGFLISRNGKRIFQKVLVLLNDFAFYSINFQDNKNEKAEITIKELQCLKDL